MYQLSALKSLLSKDTYKKYRNHVKEADFEEVSYVLEAVDAWHQNFPGDAAVEDIANIVFTKGVRDKDRAFVETVMRQLGTINGEDTIGPLLERIRADSLCQQISVAAYGVSAGRGTPADVIKLTKELETPSESMKIEYVTDDINDILDNTVRKPGLRWRLDSLNKSLGSLRKGDFGFIFARPETGKTTFLASEVTNMAGQLLAQSGPILWFNNEEQGRKVKLRCYQAALGATLDHLLRAPDRAKAKYEELTKGKIKIFDSASIHRRQVEAICHQENPALILFDQIDKIKGFTSDREDLVMGAIYAWARELSKTYAPVVGVCQAEGFAEGEKWLHMGNVANAKTSKQGEADFILGIGKSHEPGFETIRYFNISKNKLVGDQDSVPSLRHGRIEVIIEPEIARYRDIK